MSARVSCEWVMWAIVSEEGHIIAVFDTRREARGRVSTAWGQRVQKVVIKAAP